MTIVFLLSAVAAILLVAASAFIFRELLVASGPPKRKRKDVQPVSTPQGHDAPPLRRAA